jgi:hypothetical protein
MKTSIRKLEYPIYKFWIVGNGGMECDITYKLVKTAQKREGRSVKEHKQYVQDVFENIATMIFGSINDQPEGYRGYYWKKTRFTTWNQVRDAVSKATHEYYQKKQIYDEMNSIQEMLVNDMYDGYIRELSDVLPLSIVKAARGKNDNVFATEKYKAQKTISDIIYLKNNGNDESKIKARIKEHFKILRG